jgi:hypothetical protein
MQNVWPISCPICVRDIPLQQLAEKIAYAPLDLYIDLVEATDRNNFINIAGVFVVIFVGLSSTGRVPLMCNRSQLWNEVISPRLSHP